MISDPGIHRRKTAANDRFASVPAIGQDGDSIHCVIRARSQIAGRDGIVIVVGSAGRPVIRSDHDPRRALRAQSCAAIWIHQLEDDGFVQFHLGVIDDLQRDGFGRGVIVIPLECAASAGVIDVLSRIRRAGTVGGIAVYGLKIH